MYRHFRFEMLRSLVGGALRPTSCRYCILYSSFRSQSYRFARTCTNLAEKLDVLTDFSCNVQPFLSDSNLGAGQITKPDNSQIQNLITQFQQNELVSELAYEQGMSTKMFSLCLNKFRSYLVESSVLPQDLSFILNDIVAGYRSPDDVFPYFLQHSKRIYPVLNCYADLQKISNLSNPANWYPKARELKRKIVFHAGPTNSGKTYGATQAFYAAEKALYAAPLRLLATEIYLKCQELNIPCDLITGEDQRYVNVDRTSSGHTACTVEMADVEQVYDSVVIDEIQLLRDEQRGYAWTRALLGLPSKEVHVCGEPAAVNLVRELTESCGDEFELHEYDRLTPLCFDETAINSWSEVQKGDCIIAFGRSARFAVAAELDKLGIKYATIYGALPPRTKIEQAKVFNDPNSDVDVLIASDAIGMGLNLSIRRVIFSSITKATRNNVTGVLKTVRVPKPLAMQIAGRAGRFGSAYEFGHVTAFGQKNLNELRNLSIEPVEPIKKAGIAPTADQLQMFAYHLPEYSLKNLMEIFNIIAQVDQNFFSCPAFEFKDIAELLEDIDIPLADKYKFCLAPANVKRSPFIASMMLKYAQKYSRGQSLRVGTVKDWIKWPIDVPKNRGALQSLEDVVSSLECYLWLTYKFPSVFDDYAGVNSLTNDVSKLIDKGLEKLKLCKISAPTFEKKGAFVAIQERPKRQRRGLKSSLKSLQLELQESHQDSVNMESATPQKVDNSTQSFDLNVLKTELSKPRSQLEISEVSNYLENIEDPHIELMTSDAGSTVPDLEVDNSTLIAKSTDSIPTDGAKLAKDFYDFHLGDPHRIFGRVRRSVLGALILDVKKMQQCLMQNPAKFNESIEFILKCEDKDPLSRNQFLSILTLWHSAEIHLWFMTRYPAFNYKFDQVIAKQKRIETVLLPFVGKEYFDQFRLCDDTMQPSRSDIGSHLLGYCMKKSRYTLSMYAVSDPQILSKIGSQFTSRYFAHLLEETRNDPMCVNGSSIDESFEFLKVLHKYASNVFPECDPKYLTLMKSEVTDYYNQLKSKQTFEYSDRFKYKTEDVEHNEVEDDQFSESVGIVPEVVDQKNVPDFTRGVEINAADFLSFHLGQAGRIFGRIRAQILHPLSNELMNIQTALMNNPGKFKKSVDLHLKQNLTIIPKTDVSLFQCLEAWHLLELRLWFMKRYPNFGYKVAEQSEKQMNLEKVLEPFVSKQYFAHFRLSRPNLKPSLNESGSHLLGSCIKRSRSYIDFFDGNNLPDNVQTIDPAFSYDWMESKLEKAIRNPVDYSIEESVHESIAFLRVIHKLSYVLFDELNPKSLHDLQGRLLQFKSKLESEVQSFGTKKQKRDRTMSLDDSNNVTSLIGQVKSALRSLTSYVRRPLSENQKQGKSVPETFNKYGAKLSDNNVVQFDDWESSSDGGSSAFPKRKRKTKRRSIKRF